MNIFIFFFFFFQVKSLLLNATALRINNTATVLKIDPEPIIDVRWHLDISKCTKHIGKAIGLSCHCF